MRESVHVRAIQALRDLEAALARFAYGARAALKMVQTETRRTQDSLEQRHHHWQREVDRNRRAAHDPGAAADSWRRLLASEGALANVRRWLTEVRGAMDGYRFHASRLQSLIAVEIPRARSLLNEKIVSLERYLAVTPEAPSRASGTLGSEAPCSETFAPGPAQLVAGLKQSGPTGDFDLQLFLETNIPGPHLVQLEVVEYADATELLGEDALVGALTCLPQRKVTLSIYFQNPNTAQDEHMLKQAVAHEVGHNVHSNVLDHEARSLWEEVSARGGSGRRVSEYAREGASEDFAESYAFFLTDADALRDVSPEKHRFLRDRVFKGR